MWGWYPKPKPRRPANGIKARTGRGEQFGKTWWAGQWLKALERLVDPGRLTRGRSYARSGQVLNIDIKPGRVTSRVQGSRPRPYEVRIELRPLSDREWARVVKVMASQALFAAKLLAGEMPQNIEEAFEQAGLSLLPRREGDLSDLATECSCPDWGNPCKHIAAVYYLLGEQFDEDPFLIFRLRGRDKAQILSALRAQRTAGAGATAPARKARAARRAEPAAAEEKVTPLAECLDSFWQGGEALEGLRFSLAAPEIEAAAVKRLGEPPFWSGPGTFVDRMSRAYAAVTRAALERVLGD
jgi:uncharacterized Zn finger protein